jgi:hypothetical protein
MTSSVIINLNVAGARLAISDDGEQSTFLKGFAAGLKDYPTTYEVELQGASVHDKLTDKERELLRHFFDLAIGEVGIKS